MTTIQDALFSISLEKYSEAFEAAGFSLLEDFFSLSPNDLEKLLTEIGMLKGHTFKLKKTIEDAKVGILPKAKPPTQPTSYMGSSLNMNPTGLMNSHNSMNLPSQSAPLMQSNITHLQMNTQVKPPMPQMSYVQKEVPKPVEVNHEKELVDKANAIKNQLKSVVLTKESVMNSLKQLADLDLDEYFRILSQLKNMQDNIRGILQTDVEMAN